MGGREPNTSRMFVKPLLHYAMTIIMSTDANRSRPEKKDGVKNLHMHIAYMVKLSMKQLFISCGK